MMHTREELVCIGEAHRHFGGVPEILTAIEEAYTQLKLATWQLTVRARSAEAAKTSNSYNVVGSFMAEALSYDNAAANLSTLFPTLVCVLQANNLDIDY